MELKVCFLIILKFASIIIKTKAQCYIDMNPNAWIKPKFFKSYKTATTLIQSNQNHRIIMSEYEEILGYCKTGFANSSNNDAKIHISCIDSSIYLTDSDGIGQVTISNYNSNTASLLLECTTSDTVAKSCVIYSTPNIIGRPKFLKYLGSRTLHISPDETTIQLRHDQMITAECNTKFKSPNHQDPVLNLMCLDGRLVAMGQPFNNPYDILICETSKWNLYESDTAFPWCPPYMASYILARPIRNFYFEYLAGICYDFDKMSIKSLYYVAIPEFVNHFSPDFLESFTPSLEIPDVSDDFKSKKTLKYDNKQIEKWIKFSNFKSETIVTNFGKHSQNFREFDSLLSVDWWSNLKLGNWQLYEEALARHIDETYNHYSILAGTSSVVSAPIRKNDCSRNLTMMALVDSGNNKFPLYVWNYLKSNENNSRDVVIIGVNSPFYDFYDEKQLVFCRDICHHLEWLEDVRGTFRYSSLGVIFCCSVDEVIKTQKLDGFPISKQPQPPTATPAFGPEKYSVLNKTSDKIVYSSDEEYIY